MTEKDHSIAVGESAFELIRRWNLSAEPSSYELCYAYAAGRDTALNRAVDAVLAGEGLLSDARVAELRRLYISTPDAIERLGAVGRKLGDEAEQVMGMIEAAIGATAGFDKDLSTEHRKLALGIDRETLRGIIEAVVSMTRDMRQENEKLGENLRRSHQSISKLEGDLSAIRLESLTDPLTRLANRRLFDHALATAIEETERMGEPLSLLLADVDHFKQFNDTHGHQVGDQVLRLIGSILKQCVKGDDIVARYGGEEFAIILPKATAAEALAIAENIRLAVASREVVKRPSGERLGRISVSIGVAQHRCGGTAQTVIEVADTCLYEAKKNGRNRVVTEDALLRPVRRA
jgi:diguanylate cyclase